MPKFNDTKIFGDLTVTGDIKGNYEKGDILYASEANKLTRLPKGDDGQVLKLAAGVPAWETDKDTTYTAGTNVQISGSNAISATDTKYTAGVNIIIDANNVISASGGIDLNMLGYMNYAADIYYRARRQSLFSNAWEHSLTVDPEEISAGSSLSNARGKAQYPKGETEGVIIPNSVTNIGLNAFNDWSSNNQPLVIPDGVTSIGANAFKGWTSNNQPLVIPNSVTSIGLNAFNDWSSNNQPLVIPNSVTSIGNAAFYNWSSNNQPLVIPNSVTSIGSGAFANWNTNNQPLVIPNSVTSIGTDAFRAWKANNQPLVIPNSVTSIGEWAFENWLSAKEFIMESETPPTITSDSFNNTNNAPFYVPDESVTAYKTNWSNLADRIFPISDMPSDSVLSDRVDTLETSKQDKLVPGANITINPITNVISASGGGNSYEPDGVTIVLNEDDELEVSTVVLDDITLKVNTSDIVNDLTSTDTNKPLSANQGKVLQDNKVDKLLTIIGLDLQDNILIGEFRTALGNATQSVAGLLSAEDKTHLDGLVALLETDDDNNVVDTIGEILAIFENYREGADLVTVLQGKVDKEEGKNLSTNDFTDEYKDKVDNQLTIGDLATQAGRGDHVKTAYDHSQEPHAPNDAQKNSDITKAEIEAKLIGQIASHSHALPAHNHDDRYYTETEVDARLDGYSIALGHSASASGLNSIAIGLNADASGDRSTALGYHTYTSGLNSIAIGSGTQVTEDNVVDFGSNRQVRVKETPVNDRDAVSKKHLENSLNQLDTDLSGRIDSVEIDLNTLGYMNYSADIFYRVRKQSLFSNAWKHSLTVNPEEISENSTTSNARGKAQYLPNGGTEGVIIPQGVTNIGNNAFRNWTTNNQPLVIPNSVTDIGFNAFYDWSSNKQPLVIPNSVESIGLLAFGDWFLNNQPLIIPNSVESIGINAFRNWPKVPYVEIQATTPATLANANAFDNQNNAPIYVPNSSVDDYKNATNWVDLADRIFSINDK